MPQMCRQRPFCYLKSGQRSRRIKAIEVMRDDAVEEMVAGHFSQ